MSGSSSLPKVFFTVAEKNLATFRFFSGNWIYGARRPIWRPAQPKLERRLRKLLRLLMKSVCWLRFRGFPSVPSSFLCLAYASCMLTLAARAQTTPAVSVLYNFNVIHGGEQPQAALTPGPNGVYYGTTDVGGASGNGTVFELMPPAAGQSGWSQKVIHKFTGPPDGATPSSGLLLGKNGVLYGVTGTGGTAGDGVIFKLTPPASGQGDWTETILYNFQGGNDGIAPYGTLIADGNGVLYGSTAGGGSANAGVVFGLTPPACW